MVIMSGVASLIAACLLWGTGCGTYNGGTDLTLPTESFTAPAGYQPRGVDTNVHARALVVFLTRVNPGYYHGWYGDCPGTDRDGAMFAGRCRDAGVDTVVISNQMATISNCIAMGTQAATGLKAGDLLVIYFSGHGGQQNSTATLASEPDMLDETICLWDGHLSDKALGKLWPKLPVGVRVLFVTDSCNSGTNYRNGPKRPAKYRPRNLRKSLPTTPLNFAMIHYGGCADGKSSAGSEYGGTFTISLDASYSRGISSRQWIIEAQRKCWNQTFVYDEFGAVSDEFRNREVFK